MFANIDLMSGFLPSSSPLPLFSFFLPWLLCSGTISRKTPLLLLLLPPLPSFPPFPFTTISFSEPSFFSHPRGSRLQLHKQAMQEGGRGKEEKRGAALSMSKKCSDMQPCHCIMTVVGRAALLPLITFPQFSTPKCILGFRVAERSKLWSLDGRKSPPCL